MYKRGQRKNEDNSAKKPSVDSGLNEGSSSSGSEESHYSEYSLLSTNDTTDRNRFNPPIEKYKFHHSKATYRKFSECGEEIK